MLSFSKYQGAGNDFVLIDQRHAQEIEDPPLFARRICDRRFGVGADGLIFVLSSMKAQCRMRIFNADGSEAAMCGNGIRCLYAFLEKDHPLQVETLSGIVPCRREGDEIAVRLGAPKILYWPVSLEIGPAYVVDTGVPHAVVFVEDLDGLCIEIEGEKIRSHPLFAPHGVNVNFTSVDPAGKIRVRTFERGVGETLSCGTGAAAVAYVVKEHLHLLPPIAIATRPVLEAGDAAAYAARLRFSFPLCSFSGSTEIEMLGGAERICEGTFFY